MPDTLIHRRVEPRVLDVRWDELGHRWRPVLGLFETSAVGVSWATHFQMFFLSSGLNRILLIHFATFSLLSILL